MRGQQRLFLWMMKGASLREWARWLVALIMVGIGVMLAVAIHTVNHSALSSFGRALDTINGQASAQLVSPMGEINDQRVDEVDGRRGALGISALSPVLVVRTDLLVVLGIDLFQAARVSASLLPSISGNAAGFFETDSVFLSAAAQRTLNVKLGDRVSLRHGGRVVSLVVAGDVPGVAGDVIGVMDIGSAQWAFDRLGLVSRMDLRLEPWQSPEGLRDRLLDQGEPLQVVATEDRDRRMSLLSKAYRVNLTVLAMVALLTGGFLVSTAVSLSVIRQRSDLALLGVLGATEAWLRRLVWAQGWLVGALGGLLGLIMGLLLAAILMRLIGGDLGGGYFGDQQPSIVVDWPALAAFWLAAMLVGLLSAWQPLRQIDWLRPMAMLRAGQAETMVSSLPTLRWSLAALGLALVLISLGPIDGLPWPAYASIAALLFAGLAALPWILSTLWGGLSRLLEGRASCPPTLRLASWRLAQAPAASTPLISGTVAAFSLTVAMMIMVGSFRASVSDWLALVLPADLYGSSQSASEQPGFNPAIAAAIQRLEGVARVELSRQRQLRLATDRPDVLVIAKPVNRDQPMQSMPLIGRPIQPPRDGIARVVVYGSEAMADLYDWRVGTTARLPLGDSGEQLVWVAGLYRDYGRQHGSLVMDETDYERLTGDTSRSGISVWLLDGADPREVTAAIEAQLPSLGALRWMTATDIRALSLRIFDRSFAMTYALEATALFVALFSLAAGLTGQLLLRRREFGVLAQLGLSLSDRLRLVSWEVGLLLLVAVGWGSLLGGGMSQILIHKVNPESFHWTMQTTLEIWQWAALCLLLLVLGVSTARWAARNAMDSRRLAESLRADW